MNLRPHFLHMSHIDGANTGNRRIVLKEWDLMNPKKGLILRYRAFFRMLGYSAWFSAVVCGFCIGHLLGAQAQSAPVSSGRNVTADKSNREIIAGNPEAMKEAANRNDKSAVPYLRRHLKDPDKHIGGAAYTAEIALAKLGEIDQIKKMGCELRSGNDGSQLRALRKLEWVAGYASIATLQSVLMNNAVNEKIIDRVSLRQRAVIVLAKLVPELKIPPGIRLGMPPTEDQYQEWSSWLSEHRSELSKLQPAEYVDPSPSDCQETRDSTDTSNRAHSEK